MYRMKLNSFLVGAVRREITSAELDHLLDSQEASLFVDNVNVEVYSSRNDNCHRLCLCKN